MHREQNDPVKEVGYLMSDGKIRRDSDIWMLVEDRFCSCTTPPHGLRIFNLKNDPAKESEQNV